MLNAHAAGRNVLLPRALATTLRDEAIRAVERVRVSLSIPLLWRAWEGWARPDSHLKTQFYTAVVPHLVDRVIEELNVARRYGRTSHKVYAGFAQLITYVSRPSDTGAFAAAVNSSSLAIGHGRTLRQRFWPLVHEVFRHFTQATNIYMDGPAVVLLLRTISAFDIAGWAQWAPFLLDQILLGGDAFASVLKSKHRGHMRALLMGTLEYQSRIIECNTDQTLESIGTKIAAVVHRIGVWANVWNGLVLYFNGYNAHQREARQPVWAHTLQVLGDDVANSLCIRKLAGDKTATLAGIVLLKAMPLGALLPVAERLCEPELITEFLWEDFENANVVNYIGIIAKRSDDLRQLIVSRFGAHSTFAAEWIRDLMHDLVV